MPTLTTEQATRVEQALLALGNLRRSPADDIGVSPSRLATMTAFAQTGHGWNDTIRATLISTLGNNGLWNRASPSQRKRLAELAVEICSGSDNAAIEELNALGLGHILTGSTPMPPTSAILVEDDEDEDEDEEDDEA